MFTDNIYKRIFCIFKCNYTSADPSTHTLSLSLKQFYKYHYFINNLQDIIKNYQKYTKDTDLTKPTFSQNMNHCKIK